MKKRFQKSKRFRYLNRNKIIKKILKQPVTPPSTRRYCLYCQKMRTFKYNRRVMHSECIYCGSRMSLKEEPRENDILPYPKG